jgi:hypothetical protein
MTPNQYREDVTYSPGDRVSFSNTVWQCCSQSPGKPSQAAGWMLLQKQPRGPAGKDGHDGADGATIKDIIQSEHDGVVLVTLTDERALEVPIYKADPQDNNYPPLIRFRGIIQPSSNYRRGDVASYFDSAWIALKSFQQVGTMLQQDNWELFVKGGSSGGGGGGGIVDAPEDGIAHARLNAAWAPSPVLGSENEVPTLKMSVVAVLPAEPDENTLYFVTV